MNNTELTFIRIDPFQNKKHRKAKIYRQNRQQGPPPSVQELLRKYYLELQYTLNRE